ncbi:MAG: DNA mismatch repair endonuclease MutL [Cyclobacteriaceae bacterium]
MEDIVHLLPDSIANQIAAGEVVQRPASAVKEMLENSIDAGAKNIKLIIKEAGKTLIQIIDDGKGMSVTDARMSFERHATSKIRTADDLFKILTMGFRGEALASIAAVSQVEMKTKRGVDELGVLLNVEASEVKKQEPVSTKTGTSISVKNLFYNVPARRNFLKSNPVELRHITDEFQRVALANPEIAMILVNGDLEVFNLEEGKLSRRIVQLFGKNYQQQLIPCQEETPHLKVTGYIGKPEFSKKTRGEQYFFVNNRFVKNNYLNHAVNTAYQGLLRDEYYPFYVLFIEMDPVHVDINVHPTKTEVKFDDDRMLYGIISSAVRQALGSFNVTPSLDFSTDVNFTHFMSNPNSEGRTSNDDRNYSQFKNIDRNQDKAKNWESLYEIAKNEDVISPEQLRKEQEGLSTENTLTFSSAINRPEEPVAVTGDTLRLHDQYLIRQVKSGMVMIDQRAAFERILFERYKLKLSNKSGASQSSLFPQQISLNPSDYALVMEIKPEILGLGFEFEEMGQQMIVIKGVPAELSGCNEKEVFEELLEQFKFNKHELGLVSQEENLCQSLAKRTATLKCKNMGDEEAERLIDQLFACEQPNYTPDGNPTFVLVSLEKIKTWFSS